MTVKLYAVKGRPILNSIAELQTWRGADVGYRNSTSKLRRDCERITRVKYGWTMDHGPVSYSPSQKHWKSSREFLRLRGFLNTNYRFIDGRKIQVL